MSRANSWGFEWETNLTLLSDLMLSVAPNLDAQPQIASVLRTATDPTLEMQIATLPSDAWEHAEANRQFALAWMAPRQAAQAAYAPLEACLSTLLWDTSAQVRKELCGRAQEGAAKLALPDTLDALCVVAVWRHLYDADRLEEP